MWMWMSLGLCFVHDGFNRKCAVKKKKNSLGQIFPPNVNWISLHSQEWCKTPAQKLQNSPKLVLFHANIPGKPLILEFDNICYNLKKFYLLFVCQSPFSFIFSFIKLFSDLSNVVSSQNFEHVFCCITYRSEHVFGRLYSYERKCQYIWKFHSGNSACLFPPLILRGILFCQLMILLNSTNYK